jgi:hypothetical protein
LKKLFYNGKLDFWNLFKGLCNTLAGLGLILSIACSGDNKDLPQEEQKPDPIPVVKGDVVGKVVVGYQGWFGCMGDSSPFNSWRHWVGSGAPSAGHQSFELWPDMGEYQNTYAAGYSNLANGGSSRLFSSWDAQTVNLHFEWMKNYGIQCAAVQRFGGSMYKDKRDLDFKNGLLLKERNAAEKHGVKFYVMYDISGWDEFQTQIKEDWLTAVSPSVLSPMYAKEKEKPVVCIWGVGVSGRPGNTQSYTDVIKWFKAQGCYVIIGTPRNWRSDTSNLTAYNEADMITPWSVGSFGNLTEANSYANTIKGDNDYCKKTGQDYQPVIFPGFAWSNWKPDNPRNQIPRLHGDFMWRQFANLRNIGIHTAYIAMFDEYDEATAIAKAAETISSVPSDQYFLTLDADGVACSADFYLRLTRDGIKMLKEETALSWEHPTAHK